MDKVRGGFGGLNLLLTLNIPKSLPKTTCDSLSLF